MAANVTRNQKRAIAALLKHRKIEDAARACGLNERTLYRWLADDTNFQAALAQAEGLAIDTATRQLVQLQDAAVDTLRQTMRDKAAAPGVRLRAAQAVLDYLLKLRELRNIEQRISRLEALLNERDTKT